MVYNSKDGTFANSKVFRPHEYQSKILQSDARFVAAVAGWAAGKSLTIPYWLYNEIYEDDGEGPYLVAAPTHKILTRATVPEIVKAFKGTDLEGTYKEQKKQYVLPTGGIVYCCSTDKPNLLEGRQFKCAALDEAGQMSRKVWEVLQGRLAFYQGRCLLVSSPYAVNWFYHEVYSQWEEGNPDYEVVQWRSIDNPFFPKDEWDRAKETMDERTFRRKYGGEFVQLSGLVYPNFEKSLRDKIDFNPTWPRYGGIDFGWSDPIALIEAGLDEDGKLHVYREMKKSQMLLKDFMKELSNEVIYFGDPAGKREIEELQEHGFAVESADNELDYGIQKVTEYIKTNRLIVDQGACPGIIDESGRYQYDEKGEKPVKEDVHILDAARYLIMGVSQQAGGSIYLI